MNPCYWSPIPIEVQPHKVDYGPDRYIVHIPETVVSEPLHQDFGKEALMPKYVPESVTPKETKEEEDLAKIRPPKPPFPTHGPTIWTTFTLKKGSSYTGYVKRDEENQPTKVRHGFGTFTYSNSHRKYKGQWWEGSKHGRGNEQRHDGLAHFVGEFRAGLKHGRGTIKYTTGGIDKGIWKFDKKIKTIMRGNTKGVAFDT